MKNVNNYTSYNYVIGDNTKKKKIVFYLIIKVIKYVTIYFVILKHK